jgi:hypothetical protein
LPPLLKRPPLLKAPRLESPPRLNTPLLKSASVPIKLAPTASRNRPLKPPPLLEPSPPLLKAPLKAPPLKPPPPLLAPPCRPAFRPMPSTGTVSIYIALAALSTSW